MKELPPESRTDPSRRSAESLPGGAAGPTPESARRLLRDSRLDGAEIETLLQNPSLRKLYEVRRLAAAHPRTPQAKAIGLVAGLYWQDLLKLSADARVRPVVRRAADRRLADRAGQLAIGEKLVVARHAGPGLIPRLLAEPDPRVIAAALDNPRITEASVARMVARPATPPESLRLVAGNLKWGRRYVVRAALCGNPSAPTELALEQLVFLRKADLRRIAGDTRLSRTVRDRASLLAG